MKSSQCQQNTRVKYVKTTQLLGKSGPIVHIYECFHPSLVLSIFIYPFASLLSSFLRYPFFLSDGSNSRHSNKEPVKRERKIEKEKNREIDKERRENFKVESCTSSISASQHLSFLVHLGWVFFLHFFT